MDSDRKKRNRFVAAYRTAAGLLLNVVVVLVVLELGARIAYRVRSATTRVDDAPSAAEGLHYSEIPYYQDKEWSDEYWREWNESKTNRYHPYTHWRRAPYSGTYINVDEEGLRKTPGGVPADTANAFQVHVFGGSTLWGTGAPDWGTIPAYLQRRLEGITTAPVRVVNHGESGYVSTQNLLDLILEMQHDRAPDLAIFYLGINDIFAAWQTGRAGVHQNMDQFIRRLEAPAWQQALQSLALVRLLQGLQRRVTKSAFERAIDSEEAIEDLSESIVQIVLRNQAVAKSLGDENQFEAITFWHPILPLDDKPLGPEEKTMRSRLDPQWVELCERVYGRLQETAQTRPDVVYLTSAADNTTETIYIDLCHLTPVGNEAIAAKIATYEAVV